MPLRGIRRSAQKSPPIFSHEFVIQNHADIVSCLAMLFVIGLMFQVTSPVAQLFVSMGHSVTLNGTEPAEEAQVTLYAYGVKDVCAVFFYMLVAVVMHAVLQEYALDKINRKMHLSKLKHSKFNESGQLLAFYVISLAWGIDILVTEGYIWDLTSLWADYPASHALQPYISKFFFVMQISYWLHCFPELYFQRVKKEELSARVQYAALYLVCTVAAYVLNFTRVALCLLLVQYLVETLRHVARLLHFAEKPTLAKHAFAVFNALFVVARLLSITLGILTFWYGLPLAASSGSLDVAAGNFNVQIVRINCLVAICLLQAKLMWTFITFHLKRRRDLQSEENAGKKGKKSASSSGAGAASPKHKKKVKGEYDDLPEADQQLKNKKSK